jgi:AraC-like DNA-binding protein
MSDATDIAPRAPRLKQARLVVLTNRHQAYVAAMVFGVDDPGGLTRKAHRIVPATEETPEHVEEYDRSVDAGEPLTLEECAAVFGVRRRQLRDLLGMPLFGSAMAKALQERKTGEKARSLHVAAVIRDDDSDKSAASRKTRLDACKVFLSEPEQRSLSVTVQNSIQVPGYVIRIPTRPAPPVIDARPNPEGSTCER